jgi:hypothetical protein
MPSWWDRFGQEWAKNGLFDDPTFAQADAGWAYIGQAPPTVEQFNSTFQWWDNKDNWLYGQIGNVIADAGMLPDHSDLTQLLRAIKGKQKILLTGSYTVWVDSVNGNDANTGAQGSPWRTLQHAYEWAIAWTEPCGNWFVIQMMPGTYEPLYCPMPYNGGIMVSGDINNQRAYLIKNTNGGAVYCCYGSWVAVQGLSVEAQGTDIDYSPSGCGFTATSGGCVIYKDVAFGPCSAYHMWGNAAGQCWSWGMDVTVGPHYTIYGGARAHALGSASGIVTLVDCPITIQNNPTFSLGFCSATVLGYVQAWGNTFTGTCIGPHGFVNTNSVIALGGLNPDSYLPGTTPAYIGTGGMFV